MLVASKLFLDWSPKQISGWLKIQYPDDESLRVPRETIYRSLFILPVTSEVGRQMLAPVSEKPKSVARVVQTWPPAPFGRPPSRFRCDFL